MTNARATRKYAQDEFAITAVTAGRVRAQPKAKETTRHAQSSLVCGRFQVVPASKPDHASRSPAHRYWLHAIMVSAEATGRIQATAPSAPWGRSETTGTASAATGHAVRV